MGGIRSFWGHGLRGREFIKVGKCRRARANRAWRNAKSMRNHSDLVAFARPNDIINVAVVVLAVRGIGLLMRPSS